MIIIRNYVKFYKINKVLFDNKMSVHDILVKPENLHYNKK